MNNTMKKVKITILLAGLLIGVISAYARTVDTLKIHRHAQATFVHPLGTNKEEAPSVINNFSFNLFYGVSGGVHGVEIGGLINRTYGDVRGFQFAGLGNSSSGSVSGFQAAGLYNLTGGRMSGAQLGGLVNSNRKDVSGAGFAGIAQIANGSSNGAYFAGLANVNSGYSIGAYFAGITNVTLGGSHGVQFSGLANLNKGQMNGALFSGLATVNTGNMDGVQFSGLSNVNLGKLEGVQFAGLSNVVVKEAQGTQVAGLSNVAVRSAQSQIAGLANVAVQGSHGLQLAGLANISTVEYQGAQIAGFMNYTRNLNGLQLACLNIADTVKSGVPVGLISIVVEGYRRFELEGNEVLYLNANFKTGTTKFYNILSIGYRPEGEKQYWGITYGIGTLVPLSKRFNFNFDVTATHLNEDEAWTNTLNLLNRLKFNFSYMITRRLEVIAGPSLNIAISRLKDSEGSVTGSSIVPSYGFYDEVIRGTQVKIYAGFNAGIRF